MNQLNKLSIELLANAFTEQEKKVGHVFVLLGLQETVVRIREFWRVMVSAHPDGLALTIWGRPLLVSNDVPVGQLVLGVHEGGRSTMLLDFTRLQGLMVQTQPPNELDDVWLERLSL